MSEFFIHERETTWAGLTASDDNYEARQVLDVFGFELGLLLAHLEETQRTDCV